MGHPSKVRKKYANPSHPWQKDRIEEEKELTREYGYKNKKEIWKTNALLSSFKRQAKKLSASTTEQSQKETYQLMQKLKRLGLLQGENPTYDDVLSLSVKDVAERRLQTILLRKKLARSPKQARQFITHQHIQVSGRTVTAPSYLVKQDEEGSVTFNPTSHLANEEHPERVADKEMEEIKEEVKRIKEAQDAANQAESEESDADIDKAAEEGKVEEELKEVEEKAEEKKKETEGEE